ncbi:hypothetical protein [Spiroplasma endosymbiont of Apeira syringaria]|uniref:hypothetical protein n=1 Tax=Spiroplasma endosymbiont of Apeira syringaria TaxID=3066307 RepID=UPI0030D5BB32
MQDIAVQFEKHFWIHSVSLFPPQVHVGRSPKINMQTKKFIIKTLKKKNLKKFEKKYSYYFTTFFNIY